MGSLGKNASFLVGDFNIDVLKYNSCNYASEYIDLLFSHGFIQVVTKPTRCSHESATLIDHVITNVTKSSLNISILTSQLSDHFPVNLNLTFETTSNKNGSIRFRDFKRLDDFKTTVANSDLREVLDLNDCQTAWNAFQNSFNELYNLFFPERTVKLNRNFHKIEKWFTNGLLTSRRRKIHLENLLTREPCEENAVNFKTFKCIYNKTVRAAKKAYFCEELVQHQSDLKYSWELIRKATNKKSKKGKQEIVAITNNDTDITDPLIIAEHLNKHFGDAPQKIINELRPMDIEPFPGPIQNEGPSFENSSPITPNEIIEATKLLGNKSSTDHNNVSMSFIKKILHLIVLPITHLFNLSFSSGAVPTQLKIAKIIPIFKGGDPKNTDNYRPISLLDNFSKIIEKIMCLRLTSFLDTHSCLSNSQFGFRKNHSTVHPMVRFNNFISDSLNKKEHSIAIFCDLRKAFDTVDHTILLNKLKNLGVRGISYEWFKSYLSGRRQYVTINNKSSKTIKIKIGVPQGSILGPLLFLIYINDLAHSSKLLTLMFADDTTLLFSGPNIEKLYEIVNREFHKVVTFFRANKLALHPKKTNYILYTNSNTAKNTELSIFINNCNTNELPDPTLVHPILRVLGTDADPSVKFLGIYLDPKLNFKHHLQIIRGKISTGLYFLRNVKHLLNTKALTAVYYSLIHSHILYGIQIWSSCNQSLINDIFKLQKKAIRIIHSAAYNSHTESLFLKSKILPLPDLIMYFKIQFMQQYVHGKLPKIFINEWLTLDARRQNLHIEYALRNRENLYIPPVNLTSLEKHPLFLFPRLWHDFPDENIKIIAEKNLFNAKLKEYFLLKLNPEFKCKRLLCPHCMTLPTADSDSDTD